MTCLGLRHGEFSNQVDKRGWSGGLKFAIFVHVNYMKNVHKGYLGGWFKKTKTMSTWLLNAPNAKRFLPNLSRFGFKKKACYAQ